MLLKNTSFRMWNKVLFISLTSIMLLNGCGANKSIPNDFKVLQKEDDKIETSSYIEKENNKNYKIGVVQSVFVGEEIVSEHFYKKLITESIHPFKRRFESLITYDKIQKNSLYKLRGLSKKDESDLFLFVFEGENGWYRYLKVDYNGNLTSHDLYDSFGSVVKKNYIPDNKKYFKPIKLQKDSDINIKYLDGSFNYKLMYNGKDGDNIKISYREFSGNMARTAFYQELTYNFKESNIIRYKKIKIKVLSATNESIQYMVMED